jgi:hypothetical protein
MAQGRQSKGLPNEDPATLGTLEQHERRGLRDFSSNQIPAGNLLKIQTGFKSSNFSRNRCVREVLTACVLVR